MDIATIAGIIAGITFVVVGITLEGELGNFGDLPSVMITIGGTMAAMLVAYPLKKLREIAGIAKGLFFIRSDDLQEVISQIIKLANIARKEGLLALEEAVYEINEPFLQKGVLLIVDGTDPELVRNILETELSFIEERHQQGQGIFETAAAIAPGFGMIGTLIGLINMLRSLDEVSTLGPSMSVALVTTFYGSMIANLFCIPMARKLKYTSTQEILTKEVMLEGMLSIQAGENPRIIEEKLKAFLPPKERTIYDKSRQGGDEGD